MRHNVQGVFFAAISLFRLFLQRLFSANQLSKIAVKQRHDEQERKPEEHAGFKATRRTKQQDGIDDRSENGNKHKNLLVLENTTDNNEQKIGQVKIGFHMPIDDQRHRENNRIGKHQRRVKGGRREALLVNEVQ